MVELFLPGSGWSTCPAGDGFQDLLNGCARSQGPEKMLLFSGWSPAPAAFNFSCGATLCTGYIGLSHMVSCVPGQPHASFQSELLMMEVSSAAVLRGSSGGPSTIECLFLPQLQQWPPLPLPSSCWGLAQPRQASQATAERSWPGPRLISYLSKARSKRVISRLAHLQNVFYVGIFNFLKWCN